MKKAKNGFTLIELLAVIVILAIIALIAVPVILNIIDKANKSAFKDTAYSVVNAGEYYWTKQQLEPSGMLEDVLLSVDNEILELKGDIPNGNILITRDGKIAIAVKNDRYCVTKGFYDSDVTIIENYETCELPVKPITNPNKNIVSTSDCTKYTEICEPGTEVTVQVNETEKYNFYVINDTGSEMTLIMDKNLGSQVAWVNQTDYNDDANFGEYGKNNKGPITALNYLNSQTSTWTNVPVISSYTYNNNLNGNTNTYGYQKLEITNGTGILTSQAGTETNTISGTSRARLLTYEEAETLYIENSNVTPEYLYTNLSSTNTIDKQFGYWFLTAYPTDSVYGRYMNYTNAITYYSHVYYPNDLGVRPVIAINK